MGVKSNIDNSRLNTNKFSSLHSSFSYDKVRHFSTCYRRNAELYSDSTPFYLPLEYKYGNNLKRDKRVITINTRDIRDIYLFVTNFIKSVAYNHYSVFIKIKHDGVYIQWLVISLVLFSQIINYYMIFRILLYKKWSGFLRLIILGRIC